MCPSAAASRTGPPMPPGLQVKPCRAFLTLSSNSLSDASSTGGDAGLPRLLEQLPSLQAAGYIMHSRWFSNETDYAKVNGGNFTFAVEHDSSAFPGNGTPLQPRITYAFAFIDACVMYEWGG